MNSAKKTLHLLLKQYPEASEIVSKVSNVNIYEIDLSIPTKARGHQQSATELSKLLYGVLTPYSAGENIYPVLCEYLLTYFKEKIKHLLGGYLTLVDDRVHLSESLAKQSVDSLSDAVKKLCFFCTKINQLEIGENYNWGDALNNYPVILEKISMHERHVKGVLTNVLSKLEKDKVNIQSMFGIESFMVIELDLFLGDFHKVGESVVKIKLTNSTLIYKPRGANNEKIISEMLFELFNDNLKIGLPRFIDFDCYSWHEFITYSNPNTKSDTLDYYNKIGLSLAFFHCLNGTDFHFENIICSNSTPYFIDLECVFTHPHHSSLISNSVLSTFIIPTLQGTVSDHLICGISNKEILINKKTLEMSKDGELFHEDAHIEPENKYNAPMYTDTVTHDEITNEIINGFEKMVGLLKTRKTIHEKILKSKTLKGRMLFRTTKLYSDIITVSNHPAYSSIPALRNAYIACALYSEDIPLDIIKHEYLSLIEGRIPIFYVDLINEVFTTEEGHQIEVSENDSPRKNFLSKVFRMTNEYEEYFFQKELINISLQSISPRLEEGKTVDCGFEKVIDFMSIKTCHYKKKEIYLNLKKEKNGSRSLSVMRSDLYSGLGGATFLQICNLIAERDVQKENKLELLYRSTLALDSNESGNDFGCFDSKGGMLYLEYLIAKHTTGLIKYPMILKRLLSIVRRVENQSDANYDIISGMAGVLITCCRLHNSFPTKHSEIAIKVLAKRLINQAHEKIENTLTWGRGWPGFSHGNSGVTYALALANNTLNDDRIDSVIIKSLRYEETFKIDSGWNGVDAYDTNMDFNSWCHGAPGIYMTRAALLNEMKSKRTEIEDILLSDIQHFHDTHKNRGLNEHQSLCHGMYGNAIIDPITYGTHFNVDVPVDDQSEEKSLMLSRVGAIYANFYFLHRDKGVPNLLILE